MVDPIKVKELSLRALCDERTARKAFSRGTSALQPLVAARLTRAASELGYVLPVRVDDDSEPESQP